MWLPTLPYNAVICRYNEIGTKGRNRLRFEDQLTDALKRSLAPLGRIHIDNVHGRLFITVTDKPALTDDDIQTLRKVIPTVAGVSSVSPGFLVKPDFDAISAVIHEHFPALVAALSAASPALPMTYSMRAHRANKAFPMTSEELEKHFARELLPQYPERPLDLSRSSLTVELEIRHHEAFISVERIEGPGGLPVGSAGRVLALLSGGIDSPVACFQMMRRGCSVDFLTFHSEPYTPPEYITKVTDIARKLNTYQRFGRLVAVNLLPAQKAIRDNCQSRYRTVLYRRFMLRLAEHLALFFHDRALVTGDNIGQVASQTLDNMAVINHATSMMVLRPLLTFEKLETTDLAMKIGTYDISKLQVPDSCTVFAPDDPATRTLLPAIQKDEEHLDIPALMQQCLEQTVIINTSTGDQTPLAQCNPHFD